MRQTHPLHQGLSLLLVGIAWLGLVDHTSILVVERLAIVGR
jgi:hypothetical protein